MSSPDNDTPGGRPVCGAGARWRRRLFPGHNPMARPGDRFEARLLLALLVLVVVAIPVAVSLGTGTYEQRLEVAARDAETKHAATAVLLADAPARLAVGATESSRVRARWTTPDGIERTGTVRAYRGLPAGARVPIWVDDGGAVTSPPVTVTGAVTEGVSVAIATWLGVLIACWLTFLGVRAGIDRFRSTLWAREWAKVEPEWTRR